jgi:hypothetical protein
MNTNLIGTLAQPLKITAQFINHKEKASGLSTTRFIQDTSTCLLPKAVFARTKEELAENSMLELSERALVYFAPALIGEKISRKIFSKNLAREAKELVSKRAVELLAENNASNKKVLPIKAAIALSSFIIPLAEFTLNYFKNLFTLKLFKKGNFNNIANLEKSKEDKIQQQKIEKSAKKNIKRAAVAFAGCLGLGILTAKHGQNSKLLQNLSELILAPGTKLFKKSENIKKRDFFNKYFSLDFNSEKGKLTLSKGQLTSCVLVGGAGYFGASKDRGKQNFLETLFRYPLVGFYIITGGDLIEEQFKKILKKAGKCKETISGNLQVPSFDKLESLAKELSAKNGTTASSEFKKLAKQKVLISGVPFLFGIGVMGFFVAGTSNLFTKYRYNFENKRKKTVFVPQNEVFKSFMM